MKVRRAAVALGMIAFASQAFAVNPPITVNIDAAANRHTIDDRIYGAAWANQGNDDEITAFGLTLNRWGGNAMSRYNWSISTANRCKDYYFYNIPDAVSSGDGSNGKSADDFIGMTRGAGAQPVMTIPMLSLLPEARSKQCSFPSADYPAQEDNSTNEPVTCGNGHLDDGNPNTEGPRILGPADPNNISTAYPLSHQGDWVQHMIDTFGSAAAGGMRYYSLDNEPGLWSFDHWDVHPTGTTYDEAWAKMSELGAIIRAKDTSAIITGGEEWGWSGYFLSGLDMENGDGADAAAHGGVAYYDWLLNQFKDYEAANDRRILDVWTVHFYPQSGEFSFDSSTTMQDLRNRSTRSLWDPLYIDESWIGGTEAGGAKVRLIPRLKEWVANHYPGTLIGITEYNWGDVNHINGATAQADILGIFGREDLDIGVRWTTPAVGSFAGNAFRMYRNYDGAGSKFGNTSVSASGSDPDQVSVFASERSDGALTVMLISKGRTGDTPATVNLANFNPAAAAQRWQLTSTNTITQLADLAPAAGSISLTLPQQSITLLVVPRAAEPAPPTLTATATSTSQVSLSWTAVAGAVNYEVQRSFNNGAYSSLPLTAATSATDSSLTANTTYLYRVRAILAGGPARFSAIDPATTIVFTDSPLNAGTPVKIAHFSELRTAVNAMRKSAGLPLLIFNNDPLATTTIIKATHLNQLRMGLDQARDQIILPALVYTNAPATANVTTIKAVQITEIRNGVK